MLLNARRSTNLIRTLENGATAKVNGKCVFKVDHLIFFMTKVFVLAKKYTHNFLVSRSK